MLPDPRIITRGSAGGSIRILLDNGTERWRGRIRVYFNGPFSAYFDGKA